MNGQNDNGPSAKEGTETVRAASGLFTENPLLIGGVAAAPAVFYAYTLENAVRYVCFFSAVTLLSLLIASFIPRSVVYTSRVILYTIIASGVYALICSLGVFDNEIAALGIFAPLMIVNPFIVSLSEQRFFRKKRLMMLTDIAASVAGYDAAVILTGVLREIIASGGVGGRLYGIPFTLPAFGYTFGGFVILGLIAALTRSVIYNVRSFRRKTGSRR